MPIQIETYEEFVQRHGGDPVVVRGLRLYSDGASTSFDGDVRHEPPDDPEEVLALRHEYTAEKLRLAEEDFYRTRAALSEQVAMAARYSNLPAPGEEAPEYLRKLRERVHHYRTKLKLIDAKIAKSRQTEKERVDDELRERQRKRVAEVASQINSIELD